MNVRQLALKLLSEYEASGKYINLSLSSHLLDSVSDEERGFLTALLYTTVEHIITYDYYIASFAKRGVNDISPAARNILRLGICQILAMDNIPDFAAVNETVKLAKSAGERSFVNGVLRSVAKSKNSLPLPDKAKNAARYYSLLYSIPLPTVRYFISLLGEDSAVRLFASFNEEKPISLTVNTLKISVKDFLDKLHNAGIEATRASFSPITVVLSSSYNPKKIPGFTEGLFFVQDEASCMSAIAVDPRPGERIADVCSAPGGKSFAMAILSGDKAEISSFDIHESKLSLIDSGAQRLSLSSVSSAVRDAREPASDLLFKVDAVLCDVPCTGLGVLAKKPDLRYKSFWDEDNLPPLQREILKASSAYVKAGGRIVYSTCTLRKEENESTVLDFLSENPDFYPEDFSFGELKSEGGMLTVYPHIHGTDGFFIAKLRKKYD